MAQGVGITPFRSMLVHAHESKLPITTTLIHVENDPHTFRDITEKYANKAFYPTTPDEFRKLVLEQNKNSAYYLSGSPKFIASTKELLLQNGVTGSSIRTDSFLGY